MPPSKKVKIGINGPGVIGRNLIRMFFEYPEFGGEIAAINYHTPDLEKVALSIKYCSIYGPWLNNQVETTGSSIVINSKKINFSSEQETDKIPWDKSGVDIVIDSSRVNNDPLKASQNIKNSHPKFVIISSSPSKNEAPIVVFGVNHKKIDFKKNPVISAATCSSNCLISTVSVLDKAFGINSLVAVTTHSQTGENEIYDRIQGGVEGKSISDNIVPYLTGAVKTFFKVLPHLEKDLQGNVVIRANRVPVKTGSVFDISVQTKKTTSVEEVIKAFRLASQKELKGVLCLVDDPLTVADIRGQISPAIIPIPYIEVISGGKMINLKAFYDNIRGFNSQIGRLTNYLGEFI